VAECPSCHATEFEPIGHVLAAQTLMQCARCGTRTSHLVLLVQIGDKAIERSTETLERMKAQRAKLPSKPKPESEPP
jgi:hypothetical protein